jgi:F0F1-type ATP synthase assembly protein I
VTEPGGAAASEPEAQPPQLGDFFFMGTACAISVVAGGGGGYGLDQVFHSTPWLSFAGLAFGIVSAVMIVVKQYRKFS